MSRELIDISLAISPSSVVWPTAPRPALTRRLSIDRGDQVNDSDLFMNVHTGTHIDAPLHHLRDGCSAAEVPLGALVGEASVIDVADASDITADVLCAVWPKEHTSRVLLRTRNSRHWAERRAEFVPDYVALTLEAAEWLVARHVRLVGIDYLSVQRYADPPVTHHVLLRAGVVLLEGLDLSGVAQGPYELLCLPLKLLDSDGAPARAILRRLV